jgi:hypothetical protein
MALISCPECKQQISDTAVTCPHCGVKLHKSSIAQFFNRLFTYIILAGVAVLAVYLYVNVFSKNKTQEPIPSGQYVRIALTGDALQRIEAGAKGIALLITVGDQFMVSGQGDTIISTAVGRSGSKFKVELTNTANEYMVDIPLGDGTIKQVPCKLTPSRNLKFMFGSDSLVYRKN